MRVCRTEFRVIATLFQVVDFIMGILVTVIELVAEVSRALCRWASSVKVIFHSIGDRAAVMLFWQLPKV
jgi:hypothetical protein